MLNNSSTCSWILEALRVLNIGLFRHLFADLWLSLMVLGFQSKTFIRDKCELLLLQSAFS